MSDFLTTRTGAIPIGFRRGWSDWQKDLSALVKWAGAHRLGVIDLGSDADVTGPVVLDAGLRIGSADLGGFNDWKTLLSADENKRRAGVEKMSGYIAACGKLGIQNFFFILIPDDPALERKKNLALAVESLSALEPVLRENQARVVIEGWPGPGALSCTPEGYRAVFAGCPSPVFGVNYDPSHLLRMMIDPVRFLEEFHARVYHVHGKDTDIDLQAIYDYGVEQPTTFASAPAFGGSYWRYTIPGHGQARWPEIMKKLAAIKYSGAISIELEDASFNGSTEGEQAGLLASAAYLASV